MAAASLLVAVSACAADGPPGVQLTFTEKTLPSSPGYHIFHATASAGGKKIPVACGIFLPRGYFRPTDPMPVVVTLHNRGPSGFDGGGMDGEGLAALVTRTDPDTRGSGDMPAHPLNVHDDAQFITLVPQCPPGFDWYSGPVPEILGELIARVTRQYRCDPDRVCLTGFSYGGTSTWRVALRLPGRFSAIAILDGRATPNPAADALKLKDVAACIVVGADDGGFIPEAERMRDALTKSKHPNFRYRVVPHGNHWGYAPTYRDPEFWTWMFSQRRAGTTRPSSRPATRRIVSAATIPTTRPTTASATQPFRAAVLCQYFRDLPGTQLSDFTSAQAFPRFPDEQIMLGQLELPPSETDNFASVMRATLRAPQTGEFVFYISGQDQCELWISSDRKPEHLQRIAQVSEWSLPRDYSADPRQQSNPVHLAAGASYLVEARHKHGVGDSHCSVAWRLPDGTIESPVPGSRLSPAPVVDVPPARVTAVRPAALPAASGSHRVLVTVDYLGHQQEVCVSVILPRGYKATEKWAALVYCAEGDQAISADGPMREFANGGTLANSLPLIVLSVERPAGRSWENLWLEHAAAAVLEKLLGDLPIDAERVYLTGAGAGTIGVWSLAPLLPGRFAAVVPFNPQIAGNPTIAPSLNSLLATSLDGAKVHFITGVEDGMATDRANRLHDSLGSILPPSDVVYEMHMGTETARVYYARPEFYKWLLTWRRPVGRRAEQVTLPATADGLPGIEEVKKKIIGTIVSLCAATAAAMAIVLAIVAYRRRRR